MAFSACNSGKRNVPDGVLSEEKMEAIITDIQLIEAAHQMINDPTLNQKRMRDTSFAIIYNKHETTVQEFDSSLKVYTQYPEVFSEIMKRVDENLNKTK